MLASAVRCTTFCVKWRFVLPDFIKNSTVSDSFFESSFRNTTTTFITPCYSMIWHVLHPCCSGYCMYLAICSLLTELSNLEDSQAFTALYVSADELWKCALAGINFGLTRWFVMSALQVCAVFFLSKWDVVTHVEKTGCLDEVTDGISLTRRVKPCRWYTAVNFAFSCGCVKWKNIEPYSEID